MKQKLLKSLTDSRGRLIELFDDQVEIGGYVYSFSILPGFRRGDHYHKIKKEWAVCVSGELHLVTKAPGESILYRKLSSEIPELVYFPPLTAHTFINSSDREVLVVSYGSKKYDPDDPDTYRQVLE